MKVVCSHCGLPFSVARPVKDRAVFCCSGCALAARVSRDDHGQFAANGPLVTALGVGFAGFNQVLFWLLSELLARRADGEAGSEAMVNAARVAWASLGLGAAVWLTIVVIQWRLGARRIADMLVVLSGATLLGIGIWMPSPACALAATATQGAWALRGLKRKKKPA
jgi:hypothetical protein